MFGGGGSIPAPAPVQPAPRVEDRAVQEAAAEALRRRRRQRGYRSTILRSSMMDTDVIQRLETLGS